METFRAEITVDLGATNPETAGSKLAEVSRVLNALAGVRVTQAELALNE